MRVRLILWFAVSGIFGGACASDRSAPEAGGGSAEPVLPGSLFQTLGRISLEENKEVLNVSPAVSVQGSRRGFFLVDSKEARARVYRSDGTLVKQFGRRGRGPGEFQRPITGYQLASGHTVVGDLGNGLLVFDQRDSLLSATRPPLTPLYGVVPISDTLAFLLGRPRGWRHPANAPLVHLWNLNRKHVERSFFPTPGNTVVQQAARNFGWAGAALRGDTLAVVFALVDTVYLFHTNGILIRKLPLPIRGFSPIASLNFTALNDPARRDRWLRRLYFVYGVHWLADGSFLVQYERPNGVQSRWNLVRVDGEGHRVFDLKDTPRLLAVHDGRLYFIDPASETPNQWLVAQLKE